MPSFIPFAISWLSDYMLTIETKELEINKMNYKDKLINSSCFYFLIFHLPHSSFIDILNSLEILYRLEVEIDIL